MPWRSIFSRFGLPVAYVATEVQSEQSAPHCRTALEFNPWGVDEGCRLIHPCQTIEKSRTFLVFVGGRGFV
jgi:hypothetical protein